MITIQKKNGNAVYKKTVLPNGLRVITEKIPSVRSVTLGAWIDVGSRNEPEEIGGVSHLIEHMVFKGTKKRNTKQIAASMESIGGNLNAFTSKEQTCYIARFLDEHLDTAVDVISDLTCNATLTPGNLVKEKKVVCEEISESLENPSDYIHDLFTTAYWGNHPLGRPILGEAKTITMMPRDKIVRYIKTNYRSESVVIAASGSIPHTKLVDLVKEKFIFPDGSATAFEPAKAPIKKRSLFETNNNNQIHLCLGFPGLAYNAKEKIAALTLHAYLGGGMSSQLFQKVREDKGLAYTVYTYLDMYRDAGVFGAYLATDKKNFAQAIEITLKEIFRLKRSKIPAVKLQEVKEQLKGHLTLGMESTSSRMNRLARNELMAGTYTTLRKTLNDIDKVTAADIADLVQRIADMDRAALAVLGPVSKKHVNGIF